MKERVVQGYERSGRQRGACGKRVEYDRGGNEGRKERGQARESNKRIIGRRIG